jgi:hypothetical protein
MPPSGLEQKSPEEQDRQDDGNSDDDDLYKAHDLNPQTGRSPAVISGEVRILSVHCEKCQRFGQKWPAARLVCW